MLSKEEMTVPLVVQSMNWGLVMGNRGGWRRGEPVRGNKLCLNAEFPGIGGRRLGLVYSAGNVRIWLEHSRWINVYTNSHYLLL